ncbi:enoyl-CoA hydratase/isomerase family protein [Chloroflexota bacterium]
MEKTNSEVLLEKKEGKVALVAFNRPDRLNPLTTRIKQELVAAIQEADHDDSINVIILTGMGRAFCAGGDIDRLSRTASGQLQPTEPYGVEHTGKWAVDIARAEKPIVAAINGVTAGAGISISLLCDIRIASDKSKFIAAWTRIGLVPDIGATYLLPRVIGAGKALELFYSAGDIDVQEAYRLGIVNKVVPHDKLMDEVMEIALRIAKGPQTALRLTKRAVFQDIIGKLSARIDLEAAMQNICFASEDHREGAEAFLEKREAHFK